MNVWIRPDELGLPLRQLVRVTDERGDVSPVGAVCLHPAVGPVTDVDVAVRIDSHVRGVIELVVTGPVTSEREDELAVAVELLDPVILVVGNVHIAVGVDRDAPGGQELSVA